MTGWNEIPVMKIRNVDPILLALMAMCALTAVSADAIVRYVNVNSGSPAAPYTSWSTAARVVQDAVDMAVSGDEILVTNGLYQTGGRAANTPTSDPVSNRVAVTK